MEGATETLAPFVRRILEPTIQEIILRPHDSSEAQFGSTVTKFGLAEAIRQAEEAQAELERQAESGRPIAGIIPGGSGFSDFLELIALPFTAIAGSLIDSFNELKSGEFVKPNLRVPSGLTGFTDPVGSTIDTIARQQQRSMLVRGVSEGLVDFALTGGVGPFGRALGRVIAKNPLITARIAEAAAEAGEAAAQAARQAMPEITSFPGFENRTVGSLVRTEAGRFFLAGEGTTLGRVSGKRVADLTPQELERGLVESSSGITSSSPGVNRDATVLNDIFHDEVTRRGLRVEGGIGLGPLKVVDPAAAAPLARRAVPEGAIPEVPVRAPGASGPQAGGLRVGASTQPLPPLTGTTSDTFIRPLGEFSDTLFHETSVAQARVFLPGTNVTSEVPEVFLANTANLARGRGGQGAILRFRAGELRGQLNLSKPGARFSYGQGEAEFIARHMRQGQFQNNLESVTVASDALASGADRVAFARTVRGWRSVINTDGSTTFFTPDARTFADVRKELVPAVNQVSDLEGQLTPLRHTLERGGVSFTPDGAIVTPMSQIESPTISAQIHQYQSLRAELSTARIRLARLDQETQTGIYQVPDRPPTITPELPSETRIFQGAEAERVAAEGAQRARERAAALRGAAEGAGQPSAETTTEALRRAVRRDPAARRQAHVDAGAPDGPSRPPPGAPPSEVPPAGVPPSVPRGSLLERARAGQLLNERLDQSILRVHEATISNEARRARAFVQQGNDQLARLNIGIARGGTRAAGLDDIPTLDRFHEALHNPSRVATGDVPIPAGMDEVFTDLREAMDWESAFRIDFDPKMAIVDDYFYRGWKSPEHIATEGAGRGALVPTPAFKKPRVDATYREMRDIGFEPLFWNPYEQWRVARMQGVRYREQMDLVEVLKTLDDDMIRPHEGGPIPVGWRTPQIGPAFEGKPFAFTDAAGEARLGFTRRWIVRDEMANPLENIYGKKPDLGKVHIGGKDIDILKAVDWATFVPKRAKLFGSFFQPVDFMTRRGIGSWHAMVNALRTGQPLEAVTHLALFPKAASDIIGAYFRPGWRRTLLAQLDDTTPLVPGRPDVHLKGISEAGLSHFDPTWFPADMDKLVREVAEEMVATKVLKSIPRAGLRVEQAMRRGLFSGVYPAAIITDIRHNMARVMARTYPNMTDAQLNSAIATQINKKYSTIPVSQSVIQNRVLRESTMRAFFSINESEGLLRQGVGVLKGPFKQFWIEHWLGAFLFLTATANAIHFASTGKPLPLERYSPISKDSWGPLPFGYNRDFAAPTIPFTGRSSTELTLDVVGQMDTVFRLLDPAGFISSRTSVPLRAIATQVGGEDFFGQPIDEVGPGGLVSRAVQLARDLASPIGFGQAGVEALRQTVPAVGGVVQPSEPRIGLSGQAIQAGGFNVRAQTLAQILDEATDAITIGTEFEGVSYANVPNRIQEQARAAPQVQAVFKERPPDIGTPRQQVTAAFENYNRAQTAHEAGLRSLIDQGVAGMQLRKAIQDFKQNRFTSAQTVFESPEVQKQFAESESKQPEDILRTAYMTAPLPETAPGVFDFDARDAFRQQVLAQADILGISRERVMRPTTIDDKVVEAVVREFDADQEALKEYWSIRELVAESLLPAHREFYLAWLVASPTERNETRRTRGDLINPVEAYVRRVQQDYRATHHIVDGLLAKWEYSTAIPQTVGGQLQREELLR